MGDTFQKGTNYSYYSNPTFYYIGATLTLIEALKGTLIVTLFKGTLLGTKH